jgi:hypothetical protein
VPGRQLEACGIERVEYSFPICAALYARLRGILSCRYPYLEIDILREALD